MDTLNRNQLGEVGRFGEDQAAEYLEKNGYEIVARNMKFGKLELDIVAENEDHIAFVEVKTRTVNKFTGTGRFGPPSASVTYEKQRNTAAAARQYLREYDPGKFPRLDVIEVYVIRADDGTLKTDRINHLKGAFTARGRSTR